MKEREKSVNTKWAQKCENRRIEFVGRRDRMKATLHTLHTETVRLENFNEMLTAIVKHLLQ